MANETWVVVMSRGTGTNTIIATSAAVRVDDHRLNPVHQTMISDKLQQTGVNLGAVKRTLIVGSKVVSRLAPLIDALDRGFNKTLGKRRENVLLKNWRGNAQNINVANRAE